MTTGMRRTHDFCWLNLMTPDGARAKEFFAGLFDWTWAPMPGVPGGTLIRVDGKQAGAVMDLDAADLPRTMPPSIGVMIRVDDADALVAKIRAAGGTADDASDVLENGRMAMCASPDGARFALWQPKRETTIEADTRKHGAPSWFETLTPDLARAVPFYTSVFGWTTETMDGPNGPYIRFLLDGLPVGGAFAPPGKTTPVPAHWGVYFTVDDPDAAVARAASLGATVCMPAQDIPGIGRFAMLRSPQGVAFYVARFIG